MTHHHHGHEHHHHEIKSDLTFTEKLSKLLEHWLKHNQDHAHTYEDWAERARANGLSDIGSLLDDVCQLTVQINDRFKQAADKLHCG